ncbi:MAG TPA: AprI/Inh family metalloprotease inhibitor [Pseudolabrys sp.]|nr:AprI/Inh family metalloprotease inhibitor [Pseudolabrys sp.]
MPTIGVTGGAVVALLLAGCAANPLGEATPAAAPERPLIMNGRWILSAPNAPSCGINFEGAAGGQGGTLMPEGGCPGNFFTSRRWTLAQGALTIADENNQPLAQLAFADGRFEGKTTAGAPVTLNREPSVQ